MKASGLGCASVPVTKEANEGHVSVNAPLTLGSFLKAPCSLRKCHEEAGDNAQGQS